MDYIYNNIGFSIIIGTSICLITPTIIRKTYKFIKNTKFVKHYIKKQINNTVEELKKEFFQKYQDEPIFNSLPSQKINKSTIINHLKYYKDLGNIDWENGKISGTIYANNDKLSNLIIDSYKLYQWSNPLHTDVFPGIQKMEASIIKMCLHLYKGNSDSTGTMTSGGTESIIMACKAYRDWARNTKGITKPEMIIADSAHVAFDKAAQYLGIKIRRTKVDYYTKKAYVNSFKRYINKYTIMLVGSAPSFPHGVIDPIEDLAELAHSKNIGFHMDACLGGFILPFKQNCKKYNFEVTGLTSISMDTHKYGYTPKGSSVILWASRDFAHYQYFVQPSWPGGIYISPSIAGSRSGALIAATWSSMIYHGFNGYKESVDKIINVVRYIVSEIATMDEIELVAKPDTTVIAFKSKNKNFNIYTLGSAMNDKGWSLNALQYPPALHICITMKHMDIKEEFVEDLRKSIQEVSSGVFGTEDGMAAIYGKAQKIPDKSIIKEIGYGYLDAYYE